MATSTEVASLFATISLKDNLTSGLSTARGTLAAFGSNIDALGQKMVAVGSAGQQMMQPFTNAVIDSVTAAMDFDEAMTNANSILMLSGSEIDAISDKILAMGANAMAGPQQVANAYYDIVSGVTDASTHMDILNTAIAVSEAGASELTGTTNALVSIMNSYKFTAQEASFAGDVMTRTVGMGVLTMDELAASIGSVSPIAHTMGIAFNDLGSYVAYMTTQGASAGEATTQLSGMMTALLKPTETMTSALEVLGYANGQAAVDALGLAGTYQALYAVLGNDGLADATGRVEAYRGALALTGEGANEFFDTFNEGFTEAEPNMSAFGSAMNEAFEPKSAAEIADQLGVVGERVTGIGEGMGNLAASPHMRMVQGDLDILAKRYGTTADAAAGYTEQARAIQRQSPAAQFKLLKSEIAATAIQMGRNLLPAVVDFLQFVKPLVQDLSEWIGAHPQLTMALGLGAVALTAFFTALVPLGMALSAIGTIFGAVGAAAAFFMSPLGLIVLAIGAIIGAVVALKLAWDSNFLGMQTAITNLADAWKTEGLSGAIDQFGVESSRVIANTILELGGLQERLAGGLAAPLVIQASEAQTQLQGFMAQNLAVPMAITFITTQAEVTSWFATNITGPIVTQVSALPGQIQPALGQLPGLFKQTLGEVPITIGGVTTSINTLIDRANRIWDATQGAWSAFSTNVVSKMAGPLSTLTEVLNIINDIIGAAGGISGAVSAVSNVVGGAIGAKATGGSVSGNTPYLVGEKGPELFVPGASGAIVPNSRLSAVMPSAGGGMQIAVVNVYGVEDPQDLYDKLEQVRAGRYQGMVTL